ncbi:MAG: hypothetical protein ACTSO4_11585 [Promethearchaeota archaeon]
MNLEQIQKALLLIKNIEATNEKIKQEFSNLSIPSRSELLEEILQDILKSNEFARLLGIPCEISQEKEIESSSEVELLIENLISDVKENPSKKIIYLRKFLDKFQDISEQDKNVILKSLKNEKVENLKGKLQFLAKIFKISL